jgi:opacity protein-like surface antigen
VAASCSARLALLFLSPLLWAQTPTPKIIFIEPNPDIIELDPFGGLSAFGDVTSASEKLAKGGTAGGRAAFNFSKHFSLEANYNFMVNNVQVGTRSYFGNQAQSFAIDPVYNFTPRGSRVRPYITAGIGPTWFAPTKQARAQAAVNSSTEFAFNYGGGMKYHLSPHLGLRLDARGSFSQNPTFGLENVAKGHLNGGQATLGLVFYLRQKHVAAVPTPPEPPQQTLQPLNPGEITGAAGQLCEGRVLTLHATATDPSGHALAYTWKANGQPVGASNPDLSFTPNNAGDFQFEVEVSDTTDPARMVRVGPKTLSIEDYVLPKISGITASPNTINITSDSPTHQTAILAADVATSPCGGNLTYKWTVSEGSLTNDAGPSAVFDTASLNFDSGIGQTKTITATVTATDETGKSASQSITISVNYPALYKRLPDVIFARNSWRVNNCGKRILIEQAAPQAGTAYDILLVGHRSKDELEIIEIGTRRRKRRSTLDQQRLLATAAVLTGDHRVCGNLDVSQMRISAAGTDQISEPDPGLCGTSNLKPTVERTDAVVSEADKERRVEVYLIPKGSQSLPPAAKKAAVVAAGAVRALGCPK